MLGARGDFMTTIRTDQIQCRADEAAATPYQFEHDGRRVTVLALDQASADATFADWRAGRIRGEAQETVELFQ